MSVVAAKIMGNKIIMASDSIIVSRWNRADQERLKSVKMCKTNGMLIGFCGSLQEGAMFQVYCGNHKPAGRRLQYHANHFFEWHADFSRYKL